MRDKIQNMVKSMIQALYGVTEQIADVHAISRDTMKKGLQMDFIHFVLYLAVTDGKFTERTTKFINELFEINLTPNSWKYYIDDLDFDISKVKIPLLFKYFVDTDNVNYNSDINIESVPERFIFCFKSLGELFIGVDGDVREDEIEKLWAFINQMQVFYETHTDRININEIEPIDVDFARNIVLPRRNLKNKVEINDNVTLRDENNICIKLSESNINIPRSLPETIKRMQELIFVKDEIIKKIEKECAKYDPYDIFATPMSFYEEVDRIIRNCLDRYEEKLSNEFEQNIILIMPQDYISKYRMVCAMANKKIGDRWKSYNEMNDLGQRVAEEQAAKEIKGMSFGIFTNSMASALLYTGMSAMTYASQAKRAQDVYNKNIEIYQRIAGGDPRNYEMQTMREEVFPLVYPVIEKTIALYLNAVLDEISSIKDICYEKLNDTHKTHILTSNDGYIYGDTIALRKSLKDLKNISDSKDNYNKILEILQECPYCPEIYFKLIKIGKIDKKVFEIAKIMNLTKIILPELDKEVKRLKENIDEVKPILEVIAMYKSKSYKQILKNTYQYTINKIKNNYRELFYMCIDSKRLSIWIRDNVSFDLDIIATTSEDKIKYNVNMWIKNIVNEKQYEELSVMGLISIDDIRCKDSTKTSLVGVQTEYAEKIVALILDYKKELAEKKAAYEDAYEKYNAGLKKRTEAISAKNEELKQQGLFAFSKKKELKAELERLNREYEEYRKTEPIDLKNAYFNM